MHVLIIEGFSMKHTLYPITMPTSAVKRFVKYLLLDDCTKWIKSTLKVSRFFSKKPAIKGKINICVKLTFENLTE